METHNQEWFTNFNIVQEFKIEIYIIEFFVEIKSENLYESKFSN